MTNTNLESAKDLLTRSKALLLDFDGTICNRDDLNVSVFKKIFNDSFGLEFSRKDFVEHISGRGSEEGITEFLRKNDIGKFDSKELNKSFIEEKHKLLDANIKDNVYLIPGIEELLKFAKENNKVCLIVTSSTEEYVKKILSYFKIVNYFEKVFDRHSIVNGKPSPDIFRKAIEYTGFNQGECIAFEDSIFGLKAAKSAQLFTVGVLNRGWNEEFVYDLADIVIEDYRELL